MLGKARNTAFFPMICGPGGSKSRLAKAGGGAIWLDEKRKIARCCGAKHSLKSKCQKHDGLGPLLEVCMSKNCTPLQHSEKHMSKSKCSKHTRFGPLSEG